MIQNTQLWLHNHYSVIRHWLLVVLGVTLLVFSMLTISIQNRLIAQVKTLTEQNNSLSRDNKRLNSETVKLGVENQGIAKQNRSYTRCIAEVFAKFTRDNLPIMNLNLDVCTTDSQTRAAANAFTSPGTSSTPDAATQAAPQGSSTVPSLSFPTSSSPQSSGANPPSQSNTLQPATPAIVVPLPCIVIGALRVC